MKTYAYVVRLTPMTPVPWEAPNSWPRIQTGTCTTTNIESAIHMATDDEGDSWEIKRCFKEILSITYVGETT